MERKVFKSLLADINLKNSNLTDIYGNTVKTSEYLKNSFDVIKAKQDAKIIPHLHANPIGAQLELTSRCNQRCIHCYNQSGSVQCSESELSVDEWKNIARDLGKKGIFQCVISGGEPTVLGDSLFEIMDVLHDYGITFVFISNGMLINKDNLHKFKKYRYNWFQISIDGSRPEIHNYIRGADAFEKAIKAVDCIKQAGIPLVIAHCVMKHNLDFIEEMVDIAYLMGAARILVGPFGYMGRAIHNSAGISLTDDEIKSVYERVKKKAEQYKKLMSVIIR